MAIKIAFIGMTQIGVGINLYNAEICFTSIQIAFDNSPGNCVFTTDADGHSAQL